MATSHFGILTSFDHNFHNWNTYKGRIRQFFIANSIGAANDPQGERRRAIFLSALSEGTYQLAEDLALPKVLEDVPFEDILLLLDVHFTKRVGFADRHNFYTATQQVGEGHVQWAARLRGLTAHCQFSNIEEALRDRFVMGMLPGLEKEKFYVQDIKELTLAKAVELAESLQCAKMSAASGSGGTTYSATEQLFKINHSDTDGIWMSGAGGRKFFHPKSHFPTRYQ